MFYCITVKTLFNEPQIPFLVPVCAKRVKHIQHLSLSTVGMLQNHQIHKVLYDFGSQSQKNNYLSSVAPQNK